jgi:hypothetical protein
VSPERDDPTAEEEFELYEDVPPRSIFAATWFRVVLVVIVLGVIGAVAVPYVLDWMNPPASPRSATATKSSPTSTAPSSAMSSAADKSASSSDRSTSEKSTSDKPSADKRDSTLVPAPAAPALARPETKSESTSVSKPALESKSSGKVPVPEAKASSAVESKGALAVTESPSKATATKPSAPKLETAAKSDAVKGDTTPATATKPSATRQAAAKATPPSAIAGGGPYWVQVGAFKDPETAKRMARKLRDENFKVEESFKGGTSATAPAAQASAAKVSAAASSSDQYEVFVSGTSVEDLNRRLAGKGMTTEPTPGGNFLVKPSLPLRDAVALSKDLAVDGLKVQVRRTGSITATASAAPTATASIEGAPALHRVRVGSFADKGAALAAARELEAKGYKPYIARGDQ